MWMRLRGFWMKVLRRSNSSKRQGYSTDRARSNRDPATDVRRIGMSMPLYAAGSVCQAMRWCYLPIQLFEVDVQVVALRTSRLLILSNTFHIRATPAWVHPEWRWLLRHLPD